MREGIPMWQFKNFLARVVVDAVRQDGVAKIKPTMTEFRLVRGSYELTLFFDVGRELSRAIEDLDAKLDGLRVEHDSGVGAFKLFWRDIRIKTYVKVEFGFHADAPFFGNDGIEELNEALTDARYEFLSFDVPQDGVDVSYSVERNSFDIVVRCVSNDQTFSIFCRGCRIDVQYGVISKYTPIVAVPAPPVETKRDELKPVKACHCVLPAMYGPGVCDGCRNAPRGAVFPNASSLDTGHVATVSDKTSAYENAFGKPPRTLVVSSGSPLASCSCVMGLEVRATERPDFLEVY